MTRIILSLFGLLLAVGVMAQTSLQGKVTDVGSGEPIIFGNVALYQNGNLVTGVETDFDGNYAFSNIDPGLYDVEVSYVGYQSSRQVGVVVKAGKVTKLDLEISEGVVTQEAVITAYKVPVIDFDNTSTGNTVTAEQIRSLPTKNINAIAATSAGLSSVDGGAISIRGSRTNGTVYFIDGIRTSGTIPQSEVEQLQVITGGIEAKYGDVTGGIISLTSKGPSAKYVGGLEVETSEGLDNVGYNLLSANLAGPIIKKGDKSILGFRVSGQYISRTDDRVSPLGVYRLTEAQIAALEDEPLAPLGNLGNTFSPSMENLSAADIGGPIDQRPNEDAERIDITGRLDWRVTDNIDISLSGAYTDNSNRFTPGGDGGLRGWGFANWTNNPFTLSDRIRGNFRFRHKIGSQGASSEENANPSTVRNLSYTIQLGFERATSNTEDFRHEDRLFNYGYFGSTARQWNPVESFVTTEIDSFQGNIVYAGQPREFGGAPFAHQGYNEVVEEFIADPNINPILAKYQDENGFINQNNRNAFGNLFQNVGSVFNNFSKSENDILTLQVSAGFDFFPGGSEKGRHNIQFGFLYEERVNRGWSINPIGLWQLGRITANSHILGIDYDTPIGTFAPTIDGLQGVPLFDADGNEVEGFTQYQTRIDEGFSSKFIASIREKTNQSIYEYVNIDGINPNDLSLDMFSAQELNNARFNLLNFNYFGYDYLGNKLDNSVSFDDFFTARNDDGTRRFDVAAFNPVYISGYVQDKFTFKDIIFRLGLRMDYFDANTRVLKDPYSLYEIETADQFYRRNSDLTQPASVEDDYRVYVASEGSNEVVGYRRGDNWFAPNGTSVSSGAVLFPGGLVFPSTTRAAAGDDLTIQDEGFDLNYSFEDYTPQINFMPRLAFSFPISDEAGFFAHYDVLTQRPTNNLTTALDYYYFNDRSRTNANNNPINDPSLRPVRTVDYQVGFQQKLTNSSALKISAYYRELRDLIQRRFYTFVPAPLNIYEAYGNLDFSTVKGFSFQYDRRRTDNLTLTATYTLQFADGSGSDANSSGGLNTRGPIRTLLPLNFDERHRITGTIDYRYGSGKSYNGPEWFGKQFFADAGANFIVTAVSGRPYTQATQAREFGGNGFRGAINGARLPWTLNVDMRLDKSWRITTNKESGKSMYLNVYLRAENLFDTRNIIGNYRFTGDPDNDGYIASVFGQDRLRQLEGNGQNVDNYLFFYQMALLEPGNFTLPRRMFLGAILDF
jgi:hypothetical protein